MTLKSIARPRLAEAIPGVFISRVTVDYNELEVKDFEAEGLVLPKNLESAIHKRKVEYLLGRLCLKSCFEAFGEKPLIVAMGEDRSPIWPSDWVGSISHSKGQVVAVLGRRSEYAGLGIDLEALIENPNSALQTQICSEENELEELKLGLNLSEEEALTLIFSAKESLYKLIFPRYRKFFGFSAARVRLTPGENLTIELREHLNAEFPKGRVWPVGWRKLDGKTLETFLAEAIDSV